MQLQSTGPSFGPSGVDGDESESFLHNVMKSNLTQLVLGSGFVTLALQGFDKVGKALPSHESLHHAFHVVGDAVTKVAAPVGNALHSTYQAVSDVAQHLMTCDPIVIGQSFAAHPATGFTLGTIVGAAIAAGAYYGFRALKKAITARRALVQTESVVESTVPLSKARSYTLPVLASLFLAAAVMMSPARTLFDRAAKVAAPTPASPAVTETTSIPFPLPWDGPFDQCVTGLADIAPPHSTPMLVEQSKPKPDRITKVKPAGTKRYLGLPTAYNGLIPQNKVGQLSQTTLRKAYQGLTSRDSRLAFFVAAYHEIKGKGSADIKTNLLSNASLYAYDNSMMYERKGKPVSQTVMNLVRLCATDASKAFKQTNDPQYMEIAVRHGLIYAFMVRRQPDADDLLANIEDIIAYGQKNIPDYFVQAVETAEFLVSNPPLKTPKKSGKDYGRRYCLLNPGPGLIP
ncbi:MAG: hypothetical protein PHW63_05125 [Alphaproteobacteria bacterium]|nr:hypothetical protein [Alphaproteobacteria bacterium]